MTATLPDNQTRVAGLRAPSQATLGAARFGIGPRLAGLVIIIHSLTRFALRFSEYPTPMLNVLAWGIFAAIAISSVVVVERLDYIVPTHLFWIGSTVAAVAVAIDVAATWGNVTQGLYPTVAVAFGGGLVAAVLVRPPRDIIVCTVMLGAALTAAVLGSGQRPTIAVGVEIVMISVATFTPAIASVTIGSYARLSQQTLDRVMIQGTVTAPVYGPSLLASERLTALDREVEELFAAVSSGAEPLPLSQEKAQRAAELATELRSHLITGQQNTWLHHAVSESDILNGVVTLDDPQSGAALLRAEQRDALLSALWLLVQGANPESLATVKIGEPYTVRRVTGPERRIPIDIRITDFSRARIDPATWAALHNIGNVVDTQTPEGARLALQCVV